MPARLRGSFEMFAQRLELRPFSFFWLDNKISGMVTGRSQLPNRRQPTARRPDHGKCCENPQILVPMAECASRPQTNQHRRKNIGLEGREPIVVARPG